MVDGHTYSVNPNGLTAVKLMLDAPGEYVAMRGHNIRDRDIKALPRNVLALIETRKGIGSKLILE